MEGIDRIKDHILAEADRAVEDLVRESRAFVSREISRAEEEAEAILAEAAARAEEEARLLLKRGESVADAERRKRDLEEKQALADEIIQQALDLLCREKAEDKVRRYTGWIERLDLSQAVISLAPGDLEELGPALLEALPPGRFSLDEKAGDFRGGLVISHDRIRDNLTYDLAIRDHRPQLARLAMAVLENRPAGEGTGD